MNKKEVFEKVYLDHADEIFRFCKFRLRSDQEAEDIVSEAFIRLLENEDFDFIQNKRAWLYKVSRNMIYNKTNSKSNNSAEYSEEIESQVDKGMSTLENEVVNDMTIEYIENELTKMDEVTADIIVMRMWDEMSFQEIATIVEMNIDSVKKRFYGGIEDLRLSVSREEKSLALKSVSIPLILAGILGISVQPAYAMTAASSASIATTVGSTLGFTLSTMLSSSVTSGVAVAAATAGSGLLATTTAKIIAGSAVLLASAGIGLGAVAVNNNQQEPVNQPELETPIEIPGDTESEIEYKFDLSETFESPELGIKLNYPENNNIENGFDRPIQERANTVSIKPDSDEFNSIISFEKIDFDVRNYPGYTQQEITEDLPETNAEPIKTISGEGFPCSYEDSSIEGESTYLAVRYFYEIKDDVYGMIDLSANKNTCPGNELNFDKTIDEIIQEKIDSEDFALALAILESVELLDDAEQPTTEDQASNDITYTISTEDFVDSLGVDLKYFKLSIPREYMVSEESNFIDGVTVYSQNTSLEIGISYEAYPGIIDDYVAIGNIANIGEIYRVSFLNTDSVLYTDTIFIDSNCPAIIGSAENDCAESSFNYTNETNNFLVATCSSENNNFTECDAMIRSIKFE